MIEIEYNGCIYEAEEIDDTHVKIKYLLDNKYLVLTLVDGKWVK